MNWSTFPIARAGVFFIFGILIKPYFPEGGLWFLSGCLLIFLFAILGNYKNSIALYIQSLCILLLSFSLGLVVHEWRTQSVTKEKLPEIWCEFEGILLENPVLKTKYRVFLKVLAYRNGDTVKTSSAKLILYFDSEDSIVKTYRVGDKIVGRGKIAEITNSRNPGAFDMKKYYFRKGFTQQAFLSMEDHKRVSRNTLGLMVKYTSQIREKWLTTLDYLIVDLERRAIIKALLLGYKDEISEEVFQSFSQTGTIHILAVSGLHIGAVLYLFVLVFKRIPLMGWGKFIVKPFVLIFIATLFVFLTGSSPSVIRASIMFSMVLIGKEWFRNANTINVLFISAVWMLLYDPFLLYNLSFQFSYLSLLSIIIFYPYCKIWYIPIDKLGKFVWDIIVVSVAAQFLVFPLALYYFNQFPVYFIISSIVAIPLGLFLVYSGFCLLILESIWQGKFSFFINFYNQITGIFLDFIRMIQHLPYSVLQNIWLEPYQVFLLYCGILYIMMYLTSKKLWHFYLSLLFVFMVYLGMLGQDLTNSGNKKICFYEMRKGYVIDFIFKKSALVIKNSQTSSLNEKFTTSKNRIKMGVHKYIYVEDTLDYKGTIFSKTSNRYIFENQTFYVLKEGSFLPGETQHVDYLIIPSKIYVSPFSILSSITVKNIILLSEIEKYRIEQWKICAEEYKIPIFDLSAIGYFEISLVDKDLEFVNKQAEY